MNSARRTILIQSYHPAATAALIRDFQKIGFEVVSPDSDWGRIAHYSPNAGLGGRLVSFQEYIKLEPGYMLIGCKPQEEDLKRIARMHGDKMVLNIAQHLHTYEEGLSEIMVCPDIMTFETYPEAIKHKLLYFPRPHLSIAQDGKNIEGAFSLKRVCSFISIPQAWPLGTVSMNEFADNYPHEVRRFGHLAPDGLLPHDVCNAWMRDSFFTAHFKEHEAYGLSCLESMMLGTPVVALRRYMHDKTLGRFFLNEGNAIVAETIEEAVDRMLRLTFDEYEAMSCACRTTVLDLTRDDRTVERLGYAFAHVEGSQLVLAA